MKVRSRKTRGAAAAGVLGILLVASTAGEARGSPGWSWPVEGRVVTTFSNDASNPYAGGEHRGIDIGAAVGTAVHAARAGEVTYAGALGYAGLTVSVRTVDGYLTSYLHLSRVAVRRGQAVSGGADLGEVGTTGRRSKPEPHLHFGVRVAGEEHHYLDPLALLPQLPGSSRPVSPAPAPATVPAVPRPEPARAMIAPARSMPRAAHIPTPAARPEARPAPSPDRLPALASVPRPARALARPGHRPRALPVAPPLAPVPRRVDRGHAVHPPQPAAAPRAQAPATDWGRPLALAGLALLVLALFGRSGLRVATRTNQALSGMAYGAIVRALRPARAYLPRWR